MFNRAFIFLSIILSLLYSNASARNLPDSGVYKIRLNQLGFYPAGPKIAITEAEKGSEFYVQTPAKKTVFKGLLKRSLKPGFSNKYTLIADFSEFDRPGKYIIAIPGIGESYPFNIELNVHRNVATAAIKAYYFMRASTPIEEKYAGKWKRAAGHPDDKVLVHISAVTQQRPEGTMIYSPRGWYDAGDYNKYVVNSGITTYTLLSLYEDFPDYMRTVKLNIPESGNGLPDLLNETLWNLRWMLTMQDSDDGGVYHKLTNIAFDGMIMPAEATKPRYVVMKTTAATLDFAAVMAQASRVFKQFPKLLPGLSDSCLNAAKRAWKWAAINPRVLYSKENIQQFKPPVTTGDYGDKDVSDEFVWAASELFIATKNSSYAKAINLVSEDKMLVPTWNQVRLLGYYSLLRNRAALPGSSFKDMRELKKRFLAFADNMIKDADNTTFRSVMYKSKTNFPWGSNSVAANQGMALIEAYKLSGNRKYLGYALDNLDYILGRNGTGYCYVTGYGSKSPMHPHHRPSVADGIVEPVPGLLAGGPNPGMQDHVRLSSLVPDEAYIDDDQAYATNEIAINWNAPLAYLTNAIEALQSRLSN